MEEALLLVEKEEGGKSTWGLFMEELKEVCYIAMPMVVATVSQSLLRVASMMMVGHLGQLSLSGTAIATSLTNVTGFSLLLGMACALETLCGQAYGAEQYQKLAIYAYAGGISLILVCIPVSFLWIFMDKLLILIGQDPLIAAEAGKFSIWLIPALFPYAILQLLVRYLQTQSLILPMLLSSIAALCFHVPICWAFVFKLELGNAGAALAIGLSYWLNVIVLVLYVKYSSACERTRVSFSSKDVFQSMGEFFRFAIPSAVMVCLEWWTFEIVILFSGLLPNPQLETSVLSICLTVSTVHYFIPYAFGVAARRISITRDKIRQSFCSTRISNELGAGNPGAARVDVWAVMVLALAEVIITGITLLCCRSVLGYAFGNEKEVVNYVKEMTPLICISIIMDSLQAVLSGVARGSGWQHIGAYVNLGAYYLAGIPVALLLGFVLHLRGKGLWIGLMIGSMVQATLLSLITTSTNWEKQAEKARERIFEGKIPARSDIIE
ncbi:hypothetical protein LguiB_019251 [Lonicera macranthoides]